MLVVSRAVSHTPVLRAERVGSVHLSEAYHPPGTRLAAHAHRHTAVTFVLTGGFEERVDRRPFECRSMSLLVKPAGAEHSNRYGTAGARSLFVELIGREADRCDGRSRLVGAEPFVVDDRLAMPALAVYCAFRSRAPNLRWEVEELLLELAGSGGGPRAGSAAGSSPWLRRVEREILERYREAGLSLAALAGVAGVHPVHLARVFRRKHRCSVGSYIQRLRMEEGVRRVAVGKESIADIAISLGYFDQSHFSHAFRTVVGQPPSRARRLVVGPKDQTASRSATRSKTSTARP